MAYVNENIPRRSEIREQLALTLLKAERKFWEDEAERLLKRLENIPASIAKNGIIIITDEFGTSLKLVKDDPETAVS